MRSKTSFTLFLATICLVSLNAQMRVPASPEKWTAWNSKAEFNKDTIHLINTGDGSGLLWLNNTNFKNGTIELDIKGNDQPQQSFVGVAFHGSDNDHYDAVYFRPFNFKNPQRTDHSVQYIDKPENDFSALREKQPGKYEHAVVPVPDPNEWFRVKIVINYPNVKAYVNGSSEPSLNVGKISTRKEGKIGLWIDSKDGRFRNVVIIPSK